MIVDTVQVGLSGNLHFAPRGTLQVELSGTLQVAIIGTL